MRRPAALAFVSICALTIVFRAGAFSQQVPSAQFERKVYGEYSTATEPHSRGDWFEFDGKHGFVIHIAQLIPDRTAGPCVDADPRQTEFIRTGEYRLVGSRIQLTFWDGTDAVMNVEEWGSGGFVKKIKFGNHMFTRDWSPARIADASRVQESTEGIAEVETVAVQPLVPPLEEIGTQGESSGSLFNAILELTNAVAHLVPQYQQPAPAVETMSERTAATGIQPPQTPQKREQGTSAPRNFGSTRDGKRKP